MKNTKNKLLSSIATLLVCFAMLIGSTYAWFTDTASTGVNKIQAGNLDIEIVDANGDPVTNLNWVTSDNRPQNDILWEPGVTYNLQPFKIINKGNLALKYMISITGIGGSEKLNEVITWTYTEQVSENTSQSFDITEEKKLEKDQSTGLITIQGQMDTQAGNEYQGLSIDNITITVLATQDTVENDSFNNQYDAQAINVVPAGNASASTTITDPTTPVVITSNSIDNFTVTIPSNISQITTNAGQSASASMVRKEVTSDSVTYDISIAINGTTITKFDSPVTVTRNIGPNLKNVQIVNHHESEDVVFARVDSINGDKQFTYDINTGDLVISSSIFSEYEITFEHKTEFDVANNEDFKALAKEDKENVVINLINDVTYDITPWIHGTGTMGGDSTKTVTINGNGHTITFNNTDNDWNGIYIANGDAVLTINNANLTNSGHNDGPWNRHDINFYCKVVLNEVISDKAIAVAKDSTLNKVDISDNRTENDYLLWIQAYGETVNVKDCELHNTKSNSNTTRGIAIKDQYIDSPEAVTLNVSGTEFVTTAKAAVLVTSTAGANINWGEGNDISWVSVDTTNAVWNDSDRTAAFNLVTVTGCTKVQEN